MTDGLIGAIIGACIVLVGVLIQMYFNKKEAERNRAHELTIQQENRAHERIIQQEKIKQERLERAYLWKESVGSYWFSFAVNTRNSLTFISSSPTFPSKIPTQNNNDDSLFSLVASSAVRSLDGKFLDAILTFISILGSYNSFILPHQNLMDVNLRQLQVKKVEETCNVLITCYVDLRIAMAKELVN